MHLGGGRSPRWIEQITLSKPEGVFFALSSFANQAGMQSTGGLMAGASAPPDDDQEHKEPQTFEHHSVALTVVINSR